MFWYIKGRTVSTNIRYLFIGFEVLILRLQALFPTAVDCEMQCA